MPRRKQIGKIINKRYRVLSHLTQGGQSNTYLVKDERSHSSTLYVIKQLNQESASSKEIDTAIRRFKQEAEVLLVFTQNCIPQIPRYKEYFKEEGEYYLVQEFIQGRTLKEIFQSGKRLNRFQVIAFLQDVLNILSRIHDTGILHRDISPKNLIWQEDKGHIVLIDFGIIKYDKLTSTGNEPSGTTQYAPLELIRGYVYPSSDIYSLGITAIESLTGKIPRWDTTLDEVDRKLASDELAEILVKMTRLKSEERYQSAQEVMNALEPLSPVGNVLSHRYKIIKVINYLNEENFDKKIVNNTYLSRDEQYQQEVIIKELSPRSSDNKVLQRAKEIFAEECSKLNYINKLNIPIVRLLKYFINLQKFYLVYEIIQGRDLSQDIVLNKVLGRNWGEKRVIQLLKDLLETLDILHNRDYLHLDIKPSKIVTNSQDSVYLNGLEKIEEIANLSKNAYGDITIDPVKSDYMPPEQEKGIYAHNSNLYSLGIIAIQLLTGKEPHTIKIDKASNNLWPRRIQVQPRLKKILEKMVDETFIQGHCYQSAKEVMDDLNRLPEIVDLSSIIYSLRSRYSWFTIILTFSSTITFIFLTYLFFSLVPRAQAILKYNQAAELIEQAEGASSQISAEPYYESALEVLNSILNKNPGVYQALVSKAYVLGKLDYPEDEIFVACRSALEYEPNFAAAYNCLGLFYYTSGRIKKNIEEAREEFFKAIQQYEKVIELDDPSKYPVNDGITKRLAWSNLGQVYIELKNIEEDKKKKLEYAEAAKSSFTKASELNLESPLREQRIEELKQEIEELTNEITQNSPD
ncbi:MAG: protein kinase [Symploca sp. SIO1C2]|nr:protein kinase [Symploca sp. SIO1C2]